MTCLDLEQTSADDILAYMLPWLPSATSRDAAMVEHNVELQFRMDDEGENTGDGRMYAKTDEDGHGEERKQQNDDEE